MAYGCLPRMEALDRSDKAWVGLAGDHLGRRYNRSNYQNERISQDKYDTCRAQRSGQVPFDAKPHLKHPAQLPWAVIRQLARALFPAGQRHTPAAGRSKTGE